MKYLGSKSKIAKYITNIIQQKIETSGYTTYIEPFVGGCNVIEHIECEHKFGYDLNKYLIALLNYVKEGGELLDDVPRELYNEVRKAYNAESDIYPDYYYGMVGFLASFNGRFFDGGYASPSGGRVYYKEAKANLLNQVERLQDTVFEQCDYKTLQPKDAVIYCDPPYKDTKGYSTGKFNHEEFWEIMRKWSKSNIVLISEETAPDDFECIWHKDMTRCVNAKNKFSSVEKLFEYRG